MTPRNAPESHLPLKPVVFHILLALAEEASYGYGMILAVRRHSAGRIQLQTGAFYRHLDKLLADGLVEETAGPRRGDDPRRGAYYRATRAGQAALAAERQRLGNLVAALDALTPARRRQG